MYHWTPPLYDMTYVVLPAWSEWEPAPDRFLSVSSIVGPDRRHTLGIPPYVSTADAIATARKRGWNTIGIWRAKA